MIKIKKLFVLTAIGILSLIIPFFMVGCDEKHNHNYGEWETTAVATCHSREQQKRFCKDCNEIETRNVGTYKDHNYGEWETTAVATCHSLEQQKRFCKDCNEKETRNVGTYKNHNYGEWETYTQADCNNSEEERRFCISCGNIDMRTGDVCAGHTFVEWQYNNNTNKIYHYCNKCEFEEGFDFLEAYQSDGNGSVQFIDIMGNDQVVVKPVANDGYYFLKWEETKDSGEIKDAYSSILQRASDYILENNVVYKAIFTNDESLIQPITLNVEVENDLEVDIEYLPYTNKAEQNFSYYVHANDDLVLNFDSSYIKSENSYGNGILHTTEDDVELLPYSSARWYTSFIDENNNLELITLKFSDIRNKHILTLDDPNCGGEEVKIVCNKNEKVTINSKNFESSGVFESWQDKDGNIISYEEEFEYVVNDDMTLFMIANDYDFMIEYNNHQLRFEINPDNTLTLYDFSSKQYDTIEIPSVVDGKVVTGIGILHSNHFGGTIIIPDSIVDIKPNAFKYLGGTGGITKILFESERLDLEISDFYGCSDRVVFDFSEATVKSLVSNELHKLTKNYVNLNVVFEDDMEEGVLGFYTKGTQTITIEKLPENSYYNRNLFNVLVHEIRHYYQSISVGDVSGISVSDLIIIPSDNQIGAWKYLDYTQSSEDYNKYYYNAREIDSREYAKLVVGFDIAA